MGIKFESGKHYKYEHMDLASFFTVLNTLVIIFLDKGPYVGIPVNVIGLFYDLKQGCHINNIVMRLSLIIMNIYFLTL